jgi:predicted dehydrogenase
MIENGDLGRIYHFRARYLQDWIADPEFPLVWRLKKEIAGSGTLGDIGAHIIDLAHHLVGNLTSVAGTMETFVKQRPLQAAATGTEGLTAKASSEMGEVTVDDAAVFVGRFENGALVRLKRPASHRDAATSTPLKSTAPRAAWPSTSSA